MPSVLLVGAFGQGNPGDEALCAAFLRALVDRRRRRRQQRPGGDGSAATACGRSPTRPLVGRPPAAPRATRSWSAAARCSRRCTRRPGGVRPRCCATPALLTAAAKATGKQVAMVGVGAGDLRGRQAAAASPAGSSATSTCSCCATRSRRRRSTEAGAPTPFWIGADPAWSLRPRRPSTAATLTGAAAR